ncbi:MAG: DUF885 domain-containing protein [Planctomycetes bacterium]|nr:DUF885 domain-containing protein [Planctomycetota bacterium]
MSKRNVLRFAAGVCFSCCGAVPANDTSDAGNTGDAGDAAELLHQLFEDRFEWRLRESPEFAMSLGDYSSADQISDTSLTAIERRHKDTIGFLFRLHGISKADLNEDDRLNYELFELRLTNSVTGHGFRTWLAPVGGRSGPQQSIPQMHERVRFKTDDDYANYCTRLEQVPGSVRNIVKLMKLGLKEGRTPPRVTLKGVPGQFERLLGGGLRSLAEPFENMPEVISADQQKELRARFELKSYPAVYAALKKFGEFVTEEYIPKCREHIAAISWPDGEEYYAHQLKVFTTTDLTAQQIHAIGLSEVARIKAEMMDVIKSSDFRQKYVEGSALFIGQGSTLLRPGARNPDQMSPDELFKAFIHYLRTDPRFYYTEEEDLLRGYRDICKRIDAELPKLFKTLPRQPYGVRKIPDFMAPSQTTAYYSRGDIRNAQPGYFYANTYALDQRPKYEMIALALHEAVPGHHFQIAIAQELKDVPEFRKHSWFTAYGEGWALYAERLGLEMNFYEDPYDNFGRLLYEMWRACRLVVDPGMHALGWSREQAVQFMLDNTALSELNVNTEIDRYIAWPGQATAYKIGELKIRELRGIAEDRLGERFDVRAFHDVVLGAGSLPLSVLESRIRRWIESTLRPPEVHVSIESMADPQTAWLRIMAQSTSGKDSSASARYQRGNEFSIDTSNVSAFVLDLRNLDVRPKKRFILHIDGQDMLLFPKKLNSIEFVRTPEGTWKYRKK